MSEADQEVVGLVPAPIAASCVATDPLPRSAVGSVTCSDGEYEVRYDTYSDPEALEDAFVTSIAGLQLPGLSCRDDAAASGSYTVDGVQRGSVACFIDHPTALASLPVVLWTDDELLVLGRVAREFLVGFQGNVADLSLYEWWRTSAGPNRGGAFRAKDEPAELLTGTFRSEILSEQVGPTNEGGADSRWVGVWEITFEDELFVERSVGVYAEESELLWAKGGRVVLGRSYQFPPLGGVTAPCERYESLHWELDGDTLVFSDPSPESPCQAFRRLAVFQSWERVG